MEIKEFGNIMAREVGDKLGEGFDIEVSEVLKNNGIVYHGLSIRREGESIAPTIYIDQLMEKYNRGSLLMSLVDDVVSLYRRSVPDEDMQLTFFDDFDQVSKLLFFKAVNYGKNRKKLENVPVKRALDLALVPLVMFEHEQMGEGSIMITNDHLKAWEISEEELWENVAESAVKIAPPKIDNLMDYLDKLTGQDSNLVDICGMYIVTTESGYLGAGAIFYPGLLKEIADDHESDLYIIPASVHECIVMPVDSVLMDPSYLRMMIKEVNQTTVSEIEILSNNLYRYDREEGRLLVVMQEEISEA